MGKAWVLDHETKGTGAEMVPLEKVLKKRGRERPLNLVRFQRSTDAKPAPPTDHQQARRFKVVDLMTRETLAEHATTQETLDQLGRVRSIVDVNVFVWQPQAHRWRLLTLDEQRALWAKRRHAAAA